MIDTFLNYDEHSQCRLSWNNSVATFLISGAQLCVVQLPFSMHRDVDPFYCDCTHCNYTKHDDM